MSDRQSVVAAFLAAAGWHRDDAHLLAADASFRKYWRLAAGGRSAVLMDAPPPHEDVRRFARIGRHLRALGFSAPEVFAENTGAGLLLLEDLGDGTFTRLLKDGADEMSLYALATDVLIALHGRPEAAAVPGGIPAYDDVLLLEEVCLLTDWYLPAVTGSETPGPIRAAYTDAWRAVFPVVHAGPPTLVLRDFHVDNLMSLPNRSGVAACGLLDFQDAVVGHAAYDLMSLLEDARRDIDAALHAAMAARYLNARPDVDPHAFTAAFRCLAAQRHAKVIGIFTRLCCRDGKPSYLAHIPRVWGLLERALADPALVPVRDWFDSHVPAARRVIPRERSVAHDRTPA